VNAEELDIALEELESRLERLRALYEQYFLGFEKIEPAVARKDVDRRIYVMRREKIRNTGKRFKLQTLIQRYNTFQQYWQRICREIENGTYKRHVLKAERQLSKEQQLTIATKRRFGKSLPPPALEAAAAADAASSIPPPGEDPITQHLPAAARLPSSEPAFADEPATPAVRKPIPIHHTSLPPQPKPSQRPSKYESLDLDMGFLGSWVPPPAPIAVSVPARAKPQALPDPPPEPVAPRRVDPSPQPRSAPRAARPPEEPRPARAQPPPKPARPAAPAAEASGGLSDDRVKELHARFVQAKRDNKEGGQVSLEGLAKTLRDTESKLRAQYKNRKIDFEIVVKDGKTIVKPKVR
jgi:hypothetical protein